MRTMILGLVASGILGPALRAQDAQPDAAFEQVSAAYEKANAAYRAAMNQLVASPDYKAAIQARDRQAMTKLRSQVKKVPIEDFVTQMQDIESKARGTATGGKALAWIATHAARGNQSDVVKQAVELIRKHYADSAHALPFAEVASRVRYVVGSEVYQELLAELIAKNPHKQVQAYGYFHRAQTNQPRPARPARGSRPAVPATGDAAAYEADLQKCIKLAKGTPLADRAYAPIFEKTRLQIGMEVPDIVGKDLDGIEFKLSDYRGKVVMLDFWGDW